MGEWAARGEAQKSQKLVTLLRGGWRRRRRVVGFREFGLILLLLLQRPEKGHLPTQKSIRFNGRNSRLGFMGKEEEGEEVSFAVVWIFEYETVSPI